MSSELESERESLECKVYMSTFCLYTQASLIPGPYVWE